MSGDSGDLDAALAAELIRLAETGRLRRLPTDGRNPDLADFCSNDVLGLAGHPAVAEAMARAAAEHGAGGRASRLLGGGGPLHAALEEDAADWTGAEAALFFPSGYHANLGVLGVVAGRGDVLVSDAFNHASLIDGCRLSRARTIVVPHADVAAVACALAAARGARRRFVVTESVFGMDGDLAPLAALHDLCERHDAYLVVDEAHAAGLLGPGGAGAVAALEERGPALPRVAARIVTGGKALGVAGALVLGSRVLRDAMVNLARPFVFTTAPPPALAAGLRTAIAIARDADDARETVLGHARRFAARLGLAAPAAAIVPVMTGDEQSALALAEACRAQGFDARAVRPPTVPEGTSRLRVVCHAFNSAREVDALAEAIERVRPSRPARTTPNAPPRARTLFVVGTDTGVGKTVVSALLLRAALDRGPAAYWKPVQTGTESDSAEVARLAGAAADAILQPVHQLSLPASPHEAAAHAGIAIDPAALQEALDRHRAARTAATLVVELAGGLLVPYTLAFTQADWLAREATPFALVARSGLGTLNHTLLTLEALRSRSLQPRALFLVGLPHPSNRTTLAALSGVARVIEVPPFAPLDAGSVLRFAAAAANDLHEVFAP